MILRQALAIKGVLFFMLFAGCTAAQPTCEMDNDALAAMTTSLVSFKRPDDTVFEVEVRTADNNYTRSEGFQRVCKDAIAAKPILFLFNRELMPRFHMNNVVASIDIAFIKKTGEIESIQAMSPYTLVSKERPLYNPSKPIVAALEAHPGFYKKHNLIGARVSWK